jgi:hypothetical protein
MCHPTTDIPVAEQVAATTKPCAPVLRCALKKRLHVEVAVDREVEEHDALSSASTPPPEADEDNNTDCAPWTSHKRACTPLDRRVCIRISHDVRYIPDLTCLAGDEPESSHARKCSADDGVGNEGADGMEETKFVDGPSPEAVVVDQLVMAVTSSCDTTSVCPILKALVTTGASDLLSRVHERLVCMGERIKRRGKVQILPSNALLGREAAPLICFLHESVGRSSALIEAFQDRGSPAFADVDADLALTPDQRSTAAAMVVLSKLAPAKR